MRIGQGYDVHRLKEGRKLILGGVEIPYEKGLDGHSDADVLVHAVMDALLGAAALGDIGQHFPDTDPAYRGISSIALLKHVGKLLDEHHYVIENIDATIIAQRPKLAGHIPQMRQNLALHINFGLLEEDCYRQQMAENIAAALGLKTSQVSVKATTEEGLGFTGNGDGISSQAVTLLTEVANYCYYDAEDGAESVLAGPEGLESPETDGMEGCGGCLGCCRQSEMPKQERE